MTATAGAPRPADIVQTGEGRPPIAINAITQDDLSDALAKGWSDFKAAPMYGLFFGFLYAAGGWMLLALFYATSLHYVIYPIATGFALIAPFVAAGTYEVSRRLERKEPLSWSVVLGSIFNERGRELGWMALVTTFTLIIWFDFAVFLYVMFFGLKVPTMAELPRLIFDTPSGAIFFVVGNVTGAAIAFFVFAITAISCPMLMDREVDFVTAMIASVKTVHANPKVMISWAALIAFLLGVCLTTFFLAMPVLLPFLGHATWQVYRKCIA
ncbi:MAG: DUF2189 domain-containing protein [Rhodoblastus sp.]|nr:MAG: DUF2189 domain-containing protein [Rhodoblastus sp.]